MGIRFDRTRARATNGPIVFFNLLRDETFCEEIRSAFLSGLSFYAYRFPGDSMFSFGSSEGIVEGVGEPGFVVGMFSPEMPVFTIPYRGVKNGYDGGGLYTMPERSTSREEYINEVEEIKRAINGDETRKVVAARVVVEDAELDLGEAFYDLCKRYPEAFVFCFATPATGCWIGASPELLLKADNEEFKTMALAGTRPHSDNDLPWDEKNREEQHIVADYISATFRKMGLVPQAGETFTKSAGQIEHICTPITSPIISDVEIGKLLKALSPTPALCGNPKEFALKEIERLENFQRGCYGGFCGPYRSRNDFSLNVAIRCMAVTPRRICKYAGGGITAQSSAEAEWLETLWKLKA